MTELPKALRTERARWDRLARDPYYAVINAETNRSARFTDDARRELVDSGERDVAQTVDDIRRWIAPDFLPNETVDFGCGVGRLTIPLARLSQHVTGIDISQAMLAEARRNCLDAHVDNATFVASDEYFGSGAGATRVDFVHAFIVFQHIPPRAGLWLANELVRRLRPGGIGALHFTYARRANPLRVAVNRLRRYVPGVNRAANLVQRRPIGEPFIPMYNYNLGAVCRVLADNGCREVYARLTDHGGHLGAMLSFRKAS
jgi:2-polyprenyl-3-methyl-5-hydroxy-6-metoxy-1,4-benzoquinol methylase